LSRYNKNSKLLWSVKGSQQFTTSKNACCLLSLDCDLSKRRANRSSRFARLFVVMSRTTCVPETPRAFPTAHAMGTLGRVFAVCFVRCCNHSIWKGLACPRHGSRDSLLGRGVDFAFGCVRFQAPDATKDRDRRRTRTGHKPRGTHEVLRVGGQPIQLGRKSRRAVGRRLKGPLRFGHRRVLQDEIDEARLHLLRRKRPLGRRQLRDRVYRVMEKRRATALALVEE
jgi:hypothetical protein